MRFKIGKKSATKKKCDPFLVLPLLMVNGCVKNCDGHLAIMPKNHGLRLFTKTWPPKRENKKNKKKDERPLTATLEKPTILDIRFIGKIDMSMVRKEFLNFSKICKMPLILTQNKVERRPLSLPSSQNKKSKKDKIIETTDTSSWEDEESSVLQSAKVKSVNQKKKSINSVINCKKSRVKSTSDANNNNKTFKVLRKPTLKPTLLTPVGIGESDASIKLPEPCTTCGRPDQPERFHSHPATPLKLSAAGRRTMAESAKLTVKSSVQKPMAMKYKSKVNLNNNSPTKPSSPTKQQTPKSSLIPQKLSRSPIAPLSPKNNINNVNNKTNNVTNNNINNNKNRNIEKIENNSKIQDVNASNKINNNVNGAKQRVRSGKRTLTCYICGREFGTASLSLHEPKCLEKWELENSKLPVQLRRKAPVKPEGSVTQEEWNQLAWESSQSTLAPCKNCGRTFYPDRLIVHQRSCKSPQTNNKVNINEIPSPTPMTQNPRSSTTENPSTPAHQPPSVECYICGRMFGTHSIKIHERQCLKKWQAENDALPPDMRSPTPTRDGKKQLDQQKSSQESLGKEKEARTSSAARKPPLFPCYLCGKLFSVNSIYIHEPQCLKMWKIENDKLPPNKRRPVPLKPDIKFTRNGSIDYDTTIETNWKSHLNQLVPCNVCGRTFNPDRVDIHEKNCKGI